MEGIHFPGPEVRCDVCYFDFSYTPGNPLVFSSYAAVYHGSEFIYEFNYYTNNEMSWGYEPFYFGRLEVGPETIVTLAQVPEPSTYAMLAAGLGLLACSRRNSRKPADVRAA